MRKLYLYIAVLVLLTASACQRRPLTTADFTVILHIEIEKDIVNYEVQTEPSLMRCIFYDSESGAFVTQAFLPATGGQISLIPSREYDVLVYNFDTESTWIEEENWFHKIYASTSLIPDSFKTKLRSRATKGDKEDIVYDPDHLFVGRLNDVFIPARSVDAPPVELEVRCETVVESWILEAKTVTGVENIATIAAVVTGLSESNKIGLNERSDEYVSVYFDNQVIDGNGVLTARFNTFGWHPDIDDSQILSLVFTDTGGNGHVFNIDISEQFIDNEEQIIRVEQKFDIPEPITSGDGGFAPKLEDWDEVNTEIEI